MKEYNEIGKPLTRSPSKEKEVRPKKTSMFDELRPVKIMTTKDLVAGPDTLNVKNYKNNNTKIAKGHVTCKLYLNTTFQF